MMYKYKLLLGVLGVVYLKTCSVAQVQEDRCNQNTIVQSFRKDLEPNICVPPEYIIARIYMKDINNDNLQDKVVRWYKEELMNGDTTFYSVYFQQSDSTYKLFNTYANLTSLYFDTKSQNREVTLSDSTLNEIKQSYMYYDDMPEFHKGKILIKFYIDAASENLMFFSYSKSRMDFILTKEQVWLAPITDRYTQELLEEVLYTEEEGMSIKDFDMLEYLK